VKSNCKFTRGLLWASLGSVQKEKIGALSTRMHDVTVVARYVNVKMCIHSVLGT